MAEQKTTIPSENLDGSVEFGMDSIKKQSRSKEAREGELENEVIFE